MGGSTIQNERLEGNTLIGRLAAFFRNRPNIWFDGRELALIAGAYAWRTRISDLRRSPFNMTINNRQRTVRVDGRPFVISEYCYVPTAGAVAETSQGTAWTLTP